VVFLDEEGVEQADAVVVTAATAHRVLLGDAQAGDGLAGIQQPHAGARDLVGVVPAAGGGARQQLQEIQSAALAGEQRAGGAREAEQAGARRNPIAVLVLPA
jgi:hypothetical protein